MTKQQFNNTRFAKIMNFEAFQILEAVTLPKRNRLKYPIPMTKYFSQKRPTRLLTACVLAYIRANGGHAEEIKTTGTLRKSKTGNMIWTPSQTMTGSADIHAVIKGRFIAIEIKTGRDKQRDAQKVYEKKIVSAGAEYLIIRKLDDIINRLKK